MVAWFSEVLSDYFFWKPADLNKMANEEEKGDGFMNMEYDNFRESGYHNSKCGINCKCADCQLEKVNQEKELVKQPF